MPYERNTHFKTADVVIIPLVDLKGDILPNIIKTKSLDFRRVSKGESNSSIYGIKP